MPDDKKQEINSPEDHLGKPRQRYYIEVDEAGAGVERFYFFFTKFLRHRSPSGVNCNYLLKIKDVYSATETSSYFGSIEQRKGLQQDKASQYLATVGKMIKDLFQIIRELRIMDERYDFYEKSKDDNREKAQNAEIALKSIWIDLVEGGAKNPTSVLGLSNEVGFTILPDLFFSMHPKNDNEINAYMKEASNKGVNRKVQEVLRRKLVQYIDWKEKTEKEITQRRSFMLKYLRQHYNVIRMYINWLRPYLVNLRRLQMKQNTEDVDLVSAFESSKIELELIGSWSKPDDEAQSLIRIQLEYVTIPQMAYQQEYQRGAIHVGRSKITISSYVIEKSKLDAYRQEKENEDLELIEDVVGSMDALKDDLKKYLYESGEKFEKDVDAVLKKAEMEKGDGENRKAAEKALEKNSWDIDKAAKSLKSEEKEKTNWNELNPFKGVAEGFYEMFGLKKGKKDSGKKADLEKPKDLNATLTFVVYDVFKKVNRMTTW